MNALNDESEIEASRAPLLDHLIELRSRLIACAWALAIAFGVSMFYSKKIYAFLVEPSERAAGLFALEEAKGVHHSAVDVFLGLIGVTPVPHAPFQLIATAPLESFFTQVKLAGFGAIVLAFPVLALQLYRFIAPGLYRRERKAFLPFLIASPVLFLLGAALVYYIMLPFVMLFSLNQQFGNAEFSVQLMPKVSEYLTLVTTLLLAFGLCFQLPVVLSLMGMAGLVTSKFLASGRRYAIVAVFVVAAILTPPDPISMMTLALPGVALYEISILCVWLMELRRRGDRASEAQTA